MLPLAFPHPNLQSHTRVPPPPFRSTPNTQPSVVIPPAPRFSPSPPPFNSTFVPQYAPQTTTYSQAPSPTINQFTSQPVTQIPPVVPPAADLSPQSPSPQPPAIPSRNNGTSRENDNLRNGYDRNRNGNRGHERKESRRQFEIERDKKKNCKFRQIT